MAKKLLKIVTLFLLTTTILFSLFSCEDVVDIDLTTAAPRLVIDASIKWQKGTLGNVQTIKLTTTTGFYSTTIPTVSGATVLLLMEMEFNMILLKLRVQAIMYVQILILK